MSERMPHGREIEDALAARMHRDLTRRPWWKTWWARTSIAGGLMFVGVASVAAIQLLGPHPVTDTQIVQCLGDPPRSSDGGLNAVAVTVLTQDGRVQIDDAVAACKNVWEAGFPAANPLQASTEPLDVPSEFTMCVTPDGQPAVAPGARDCAGIRLHSYQP